MAMDLLFENQTQLDEAVIYHIIEKSYKRNDKVKRYHILSLAVGILAAIAAVYFGSLGILYKDMTTLVTTLALAVIAVYSLYIFVRNTSGSQIKAYQKSYSKDLLIPRKIKVYKNIMYQSAGKNHGEYRLFRFTEIETWEHYFLLRYDNSYVILDKNGFTTGTPEDFEAFMKERIAKNC